MPFLVFQPKNIENATLQRSLSCHRNSEKLYRATYISTVYRPTIDRVSSATLTDIAVDTTYSKHDPVYRMMIDGVEDAPIAIYENI